MKEYTKRPECLSKVIILDDKVIPYRITGGVYQARYRRDGYNIEASSMDFNVMLQKLRVRMEQVKKSEIYVREGLERHVPLFRDYVSDWLSQKAVTVKPLTIKAYRQITTRLLIPEFGERPMDQVTRADVQNFLNRLVADGRTRSCAQARRILETVFDVASDDYDFKNPVRRTVLPHYEVKKGTALSREEERTLVDFCLSNGHLKGASPLLLLLYTGMRLGELASATCDGTYVYCVSEKTRKGYGTVTRRIPVTPVLRRVLPYIDMDKVTAAKHTTVESTLKKVFPDRHPHELRYTFITRTKECGVNTEVVMRWAGHARDRDCAASKVNMGYTDFSEKYVLGEAEKVDYEL